MKTQERTLMDGPGKELLIHSFGVLHAELGNWLKEGKQDCCVSQEKLSLKGVLRGWWELVNLRDDG